MASVAEIGYTIKKLNSKKMTAKNKDIIKMCEN
jgi:hypothetical protein